MFLEGAIPESDANHKQAMDNDTKDSIAEPLYSLMGEIFDMGGFFKFFRRSLISFVQITYGGTINRYIFFSFYLCKYFCKMCVLYF